MQIALASNPASKGKPKPPHLNSSKAKAQLKQEIAKDEPAHPKFDYASIIDAKVRAKVKKIATDIHGYQRSTNKNFLDTGKALIAVKDDLKIGKNGRFGDWLLKEFQWSIRTAQNYMAVTEAFGDDYFAVAYLPAQILYALASGKKLDNVRGQVVAAAKAGKRMDKDAVAKLISKKTGAKAASASKDVVQADPEPAQPSDDLQEVELRGQKTRDAVAMLTDALGDNFAAFVTMIDAINFMEFKSELHNARAKLATGAE